MTAFITSFGFVPDFVLEIAQANRNKIGITFQLLSRPYVRDSFSPQELMVMAAAHHGFYTQTGHVYLRDSDDVFVKTHANTLYGFRITPKSWIWLTDSIGRIAE